MNEETNTDAAVDFAKTFAADVVKGVVITAAGYVTAFAFIGVANVVAKKAEARKVARSTKNSEN